VYEGAGDYVQSIMSNDTIRWFKIHIPEGYEPATPVPLVLNYHGAGSSFKEQELLTQMSVKADAEGFIVAYPQARGQIATWRGTDTLDLEFTRDLVDHLEHNLNIDPARIYATGFSAGGGMAIMLACSLGDRIAAIAPVAAGYDYWNQCQPERPVSVVIFHGTSDSRALYAEMIGGRLYSVPDWAQAWAERIGCDPTPVLDFREGDVFGESWSGCEQGAGVALYAVKEGGHVWPGSWYGLAPQYTDATEKIWEFFEAHPIGPGP
jgi:polyhydroxybutyrate depolymerase